MALTQWTTSIGVGAHQLFWGAGLTPLGTTQEGSVLKISRKTVDLSVHRHGDTPYAVRGVGLVAEVDCILLQEDLDNLATILGGVKSIGTSPAGTVVDIDPRVADLTTGKLEMWPVGAATNANAIILWKAVIVPNCEIAIANDKQRGYKVTFRGLLDESATGTVRVLRIGDPDVEATKAYFPQPA